MTDGNGQEDKKALADSAPRRPLGVKKTVETGQVRQSFSHGRSKAVTVEVRKKRIIGTTAKAPEATPLVSAPAQVSAPVPIPTPALPSEAVKAAVPVRAQAPAARSPLKTMSLRPGVVLKQLTDDEKAARARALGDSQKADAEARKRAEEQSVRRVEDERLATIERAAAERRAAEEETRKKTEDDARRRAEEEASRRLPDAIAPLADKTGRPALRAKTLVALGEEEANAKRGVGGKVGTSLRPAPSRARVEPRRRGGRLNVQEALVEEERVRSLAAFRRAREREKRNAAQSNDAPKKIFRDVIVPESISVQDLASRMTERGVDVIKSLMKMGVMATINQMIDGDTAELIVAEFGHRPRRVAESDIEIGLVGDVDDDINLKPRAPVVTVMGHVDHGKTSLLDALRETDVAGREAGGITQHIGAYQVKLASGARITFLDTPGHEAFTAMRARGAKVTDIVVLVVAADDSVMPQTIEAIRHARAANVPMVVAINKIDKPGADAHKVRQQLLQHEVVVEEHGGDVLAIEVSAKSKLGLDRLEEAILLQSEVLDLKANPDRAGEGAVIEAKLERGRGAVATVLIQRGTLKVGDIFVAGSEWGRVRALVNDHGVNIVSAGPSTPVEVLGWQGAPEAGDDFVVVESEARAREIAEFRGRRQRDARVVAGSRGTLEEMFTKIKAGEIKELPLVVKADVQGSLEALIGAAAKLATDEVGARILHGAVGGINESDVTLARASGGMIIGFNVRANKQARDMAVRDGVDIRYYSIIYDVTDDLKNLLSGMLAPSIRETFLGYAAIKQVFSITKIGRVAGCVITDGTVKRGAKVRLLRDNVVIHEGTLSTLKRFKDEVKEVKAGIECGMAFQNYQDIQAGDVIECFEVEEVARTL